MADFPILSLITFLPLLGAAYIFLFVRSAAGEEQLAKNSRNLALWVTTATFFLSLTLLGDFFPANGEVADASFKYEEVKTWIDGYGISYHLGIDGISLFFVLLTTFLMPICILASWKSVNIQVREYMIAFLCLETLVIGVFVSLDFMLFYFFFEASLIPMFLIIGIWGGDNRIYAAFKFFLYTLFGSVFLLLALLYIYYQTGTTDIVLLTGRDVSDLMKETLSISYGGFIVPDFSLEVQKWLWLAFFASFAVKVPMWPVHTWLPDAHVQAPTAGSVILAGVLLKLGAYGFLRFSLPMLPDATIYFAPFIYALSVVAIIYTSMIALMQTDMKKLIAYSSIAHMGFVTIGIFALNQQGIEGAIFQMLSHGLVSAALFLCVGVLYDRVHTKEIARYGGIVEVMPRFALIFLFFTMASIGLPATSGFVGEFLILVGAFSDNSLVAVLACPGTVFGAAYMLWLYKRVVFGELKHEELKSLLDINLREKIMFISIAVLVILFGIYPEYILAPMHASVENLIEQVGK